MQRTPKNIKELRDDLLEAFAMLRDDPRRVIQVEGLSNDAGKIINSIKIELEYAVARREEPSIPFLEYAGSARKQLPPSKVKLLK